MESVEQIVIIGSGPAGLTAAIYAARSNLNPLVISGQHKGGQLTLTTTVDDYPGFPQGILGPELMELFHAQAARFGTIFLEESVISVSFKRHPFTINTESKKILTKSVIIATGASALWLGLPSEKKLIGRGVSACAVCDGPFFKGKKVAVVGGGDSAFHEAHHLAKFASRVSIIHRRDKFRAKAIEQHIVKKLANIDFILDSVVEEVLGEEKVTGLELKNVITGHKSILDVDGVFIAIGNKPNTEIFAGQLELDERGYIVVKDHTKTSVSGIFVAGDVADPVYKQAITASGAGAQAAIDAEEYLDSLKSI